MAGKVEAVCISERKGEPKHQVDEALLMPDYGIKGDAHAGPGKRQVSLLGVEDIKAMKEKGFSVGPGDFAENISISGIDIARLPVGTRLSIGETELEITQIGKECHSGCSVFKKTGECIMPRRGVFARVVRGGVVRKGALVSVQTAQR
ncbi:MAG TPA: MOSC domain-containing protein [Firmicutes bacterium]|nr:MOSC domain-containing protein [Bacillota bacterium]